jgi:hypothetical protein
MTFDDITTVHEFVDANLARLRALDLLYTPDPRLPAEMHDAGRPAADDWLPWQPVPGAVSAADVAELEQHTGLRYPWLYLELLRYQHFAELLPVAEITFFPHLLRHWKAQLLERYNEHEQPHSLLSAGFLYFADYSDYGFVCFNTTHQHPDDFDCPVVLLDHEQLHAPPAAVVSVLYPSFAAMMHELRAAQQLQLARQQPGPGFGS